MERAIKEKIKEMKLSAPLMAACSIDIRNNALKIARKKLLDNKEEIFEENKKDIAAAKEIGIADSIIKRLKFDEDKLNGVIDGIDLLADLADPLGKITLDRELDDGLELKRVTCPIGVIGVIFEARPDALVQISTLCIKSGNCAVLKGGKETTNTNRILFKLIHDAVVEAGLPGAVLLQAEAHSEIDELLECHEYVDLLIPRGSNAFVKYIMDNTKIPVMGHADGICHIYVDKDADIDKAVKIIIDAKTQYPAACNAVETILVNREIKEELLKELDKVFKGVGVKARGTKEVASDMNAEVIEDDDFKNEYLDFIVSLKAVADIDEAIEHINKFGSHHTDAIISENEDQIAKFCSLVDSAGVYANCSTRFADGFRYGFGAEVGISTAKIHARGPVGLEGLVTYKYMLKGHGHIVDDYATGRKKFNFKDK